MAKINGKELPRFDPNPSAEAGATVLKAAGVPFAVVGRVAVWAYVPPEGQQFTKDVDFAVPYGYGPAIEKAVRDAGYEPRKLGIGGLGFRKGGIAVDIIDRHPAAPKLFADAVAAARAEASEGVPGGTELPVVPKRFLLAMKLIPHEPDDERDAEELLKTMGKTEYREARRLVEEYLGVVGVEYVEVLARRIGHAGAEPRYGLEDEAGDAEKPRQK
jgi:hypothetical protein